MQDRCYQIGIRKWKINWKCWWIYGMILFLSLLLKQFSEERRIDSLASGSFLLAMRFACLHMGKLKRITSRPSICVPICNRFNHRNDLNQTWGGGDGSLWPWGLKILLLFYHAEPINTPVLSLLFRFLLSPSDFFTHQLNLYLWECCLFFYSYRPVSRPKISQIDCLLLVFYRLQKQKYFYCVG